MTEIKSQINQREISIPGMQLHQATSAKKHLKCVKYGATEDSGLPEKHVWAQGVNLIHSLNADAVLQGGRVAGQIKCFAATHMSGFHTCDTLCTFHNNRFILESIKIKQVFFTKTAVCTTGQIYKGIKMHRFCNKFVWIFKGRVTSTNPYWDGITNG